MITTILLVAIAGGVGAIGRFVLDGAIRHRTKGAFPIGTMIINWSGSLVLGFLAGLVVAGVPSAMQTVLGTGFLGGYTTFSTASVETARLVQEGRWGAAAGNAIGTIVLATVLALLGYLTGTALG